MVPLTRRQRAIYEFIVGQVSLNGIPPTLMEIAAAFGLSSAAGISDHLKAIERKGFIRRRPGASRGIELSPIARPRVGRRSIGVPVVARVPSTRGLTGSKVGEVYVDGRLVGPNAIAVQVCASSLRVRGILEGDLLVVDCDAKSRSGDLILGLQARRVLVLEITGGEGNAVPVMGRFDAAGEVKVVGRVVSVIRDLNEPLLSMTIERQQPRGWRRAAR